VSKAGSRKSCLLRSEPASGSSCVMTIPEQAEEMYGRGAAAHRETVINTQQCPRAIEARVMILLYQRPWATEACSTYLSNSRISCALRFRCAWSCSRTIFPHLRGIVALASGQPAALAEREGAARCCGTTGCQVAAVRWRRCFARCYCRSRGAFRNQSR